jgi:hypothetical protein
METVISVSFEGELTESSFGVGYVGSTSGADDAFFMKLIWIF